MEQASLEVNNVFLQDVSFEVTPQLETFVQNPEELDVFHLDRRISVKHHSGLLPSPTRFIVELTFTMKCTQSDRILYLVEATQAGYFTLANMSQEEAKLVLNVNCPQILEPYLMQVANDMVAKGGFSPVMIQPHDYSQDLA